ncbi:MAG TPA: type II toxin-antitoxin system RelE/ParE family toxin [Kofleriaceae bacterium]
MKSVEFAPAAQTELGEAATRYEDEHAGRGYRFYTAVERTVEMLATFPNAGAPYLVVRPELGLRRCIVRGFPFVVIYVVRDDALRIVAVAHMHRRANYWRRRIK